MGTKIIYETLDKELSRVANVDEAALRLIREILPTKLPLRKCDIRLAEFENVSWKLIAADEETYEGYVPIQIVEKTTKNVVAKIAPLVELTYGGNDPQNTPHITSISLVVPKKIVKKLKREC